MEKHSATKFSECLVIGGETISIPKGTKYHGVYVDQHLSWDVQITGMIKKKCWFEKLSETRIACWFEKLSETSSQKLRNTNTDLRVPLLQPTRVQKCFYFIGAKLWDGLNPNKKTKLFSVEGTQSF